METKLVTYKELVDNTTSFRPLSYEEAILVSFTAKGIKLFIDEHENFSPKGTFLNFDKSLIENKPVSMLLPLGIFLTFHAYMVHQTDVDYRVITYIGVKKEKIQIPSIN